MRTVLGAAIFLWATTVNYGQQATILANYGKLPTISGPSIPNPQYNLLKSPQEIQQQNMRMIEQDMRNYELEKQRKQNQDKEFDEAFGPTIFYKFSSNLEKKGAIYYKIAFDSLSAMLNGSSPLSVKRAVFIPEWAFFEASLNYDEFDNAIKNAAELITLKMKQDKLPNTDLAKNFAIFKFFSDTLKVKMPGAEKRPVTHYPLRYDFEDFYGEKDWTKGMVSKLLSYQTGQCHSMPLLYLILAEKLGSTAYLANAPEHTYIKVPLPNGKFQNFELTNGHMTTDSYVLKSGYIKAEALASKIYMKPLTKKETVAQSMIDLAKGYRNKYGFDDFYLNSIHTALAHQPNNVNGIYMLANYYYWLYQYVKEQDPSISYTPKENLAVEVQQIIDNFNFYQEKLVSLGYEEMPKEVYAKWLKSVEKEKSKQMINAVQENLWYKKK